MVYMGVYVDDTVIVVKTVEQLKHVKSALTKRFHIKDIGKLHYIPS